MTQIGEYCAFTKTVEHLGDRWSLLIVRQLAQRGPLGFNGFANGLPEISRSVLAKRLRKLEVLGLIVRDPSAGARHPPYRLAPAGEQLIPTLLSLKHWAERFVPQDPAMAQRDPSVITWWLRHRVDVDALPDHPVVISLEIRGPRQAQVWLVLELGVDPSLCLEDPKLAPDRYVYVEADAAALYPISRGERGWEVAVADRSVQLYGEPQLVRALPSWFLPAQEDTTPGHAVQTTSLAAQPSRSSVILKTGRPAPDLERGPRTTSPLTRRS